MLGFIIKQAIRGNCKYNFSNVKIICYKVAIIKTFYYFAANSQIQKTNQTLGYQMIQQKVSEVT